MKTALWLVVLALVATSAYSQDDKSAPKPASKSIRVFLDCRFSCDTQFIKEELPIVDFLNERTQADVHILHASQNTASGGSLITLTFLGQREYSAMVDTLEYATNSDATRDEERSALLHNLTIGLARYLARAGLSDVINISAVKPTAEDVVAGSIEPDPWNYWVFSVGGNGSVNGQATTKSIRRRANVSANRTTEDFKLRFSGRISDSRNEFDTGEETIVSTTNSSGLNGQIVKSIGKQWSIGGTSSLSTSSFRNTKLQLDFGPAVEYDFFPYSESTRKFLTIQYNIKISQRHYDELTIFALKNETILRHSLALSLQLAQKWGSLSLSTSINEMLTNFDRNLTESYSAGIFGSTRIRLFRGFSFNVFASYNRIRDQIDLQATDATREEILLRSVQLPTGFSYNLNFGFTYRFGSIFNNVVNPRMGGGGGQVFFF